MRDRQHVPEGRVVAAVSRVSAAGNVASYGPWACEVGKFDLQRDVIGEPNAFAFGTYEQVASTRSTRLLAAASALEQSCSRSAAVNLVILRSYRATLAASSAPERLALVAVSRVVHEADAYINPTRLAGSLRVQR